MNISLCFYLYSDRTGLASVSSGWLLSVSRRPRRSFRRIVRSSWERKELFSRRPFSCNFLNSPLASLIWEKKDESNFEEQWNKKHSLFCTAMRQLSQFNNRVFWSLVEYFCHIIWAQFLKHVWHNVLTRSRLFVVTASRHKKQRAATSKESSWSSIWDSSRRSITDPPQPAQAWFFNALVLERRSDMR